jgi:hypothetical protein
VKVSNSDGWARDCGECGVIVSGGGHLCSRCRELLTLRATVDDLKARLRAARAALDNFSDAEHGVGLCDDPKCLLCIGWKASSLRNKHWRKS